MHYFKRYRVVLFVLFSCWSIAALGQMEKVDSLKSLLHAANNDEEAIPILIQLSWTLKYHDAEQALAYAKEGLIMAEEQGQSSHIGEFLKNIGVIHSLQGDYETANTLGYQAISHFQSAGNARAVAMTWNAMGINCRKMEDFKSALSHFQKCIPILEAIKDTAALYKTKYNIAELSQKLGHYNLALDIFSNLSNYATAVDAVSIGRQKNTEGRLLRDLGYYAKALIQFDTAHKIFTSNDADYHVVNVLLDIALVYIHLENYQQAIDIYEQSLTHTQIKHNELQLADTYSQLALCHAQRADTIQAQDYAKQAVKLYQEKSLQDKIKPNLRLARVLLLMGSYQSAIEAATLAYDNAQLSNSKPLRAFAAQVLGQTFLKQQQFSQAEQYLLEAIDKWEALGIPRFTVDTSRELAALYLQKGQVTRAANYQQLAFRHERALFHPGQWDTIRRINIDAALTTQRQALRKIHHAQQQEIKHGITVKLYAIVLLCLATLIIGAALVSRKIALNKEQVKVLQADLDLTQEQVLQYDALLHKNQVQLQQKHLELSHLALGKFQHESFILRQKDRVKDLTKKYPDDKEIRALLNTIHLHDISQDHWEQFKKIFEGIYPDFLQRLQSMNRQLTFKEIRHCILIRLNIVPEDAASILGISVVSVHKARYRLRKKLELAHKTSLENFINSI